MPFNLLHEKNISLKTEPIAYPFNLILSSSDFYYRENFHSDIICSIFNQNHLFLEDFIIFIQSCNPALKIDLKNYKNYFASRETYNIDILIKDNISKHCIIIENKINGANDMPRQLPRYYTKVQDNEYCVDAIVYLSLNGRKEIDRSSWEDKDDAIDNLIVKIAASSINQRSFCTDFLLKIIEHNICTMQEYTFIRQYIDLLHFLGRNEMNNEIMEKFYDELQNENNYNAANAVVKMMNQLTAYRLEKYKTIFANNHDPFDYIEIWNRGKPDSGLIFHNCKEYPEYEIKFEIYPQDDKTVIIFKIQNNNSETKAKSDFIKNLLEKMGLMSDFYEEALNEFSTSFSFPNEEKTMIEYITKFLEKFNTIINKVTHLTPAST